MEQVIIGKKPIEWYRARILGRWIYFESIPIQPEFLDFKKDWDDKIVLKRELEKNGIPVPHHEEVSIFNTKKLESVFKKFKDKVIVKPKIGSRARHTITDIKTFDDFKKAVSIAREISTHLVVEDHLDGYVCRATLIGGKLAGFYMGKVPFVTGDGKKNISNLIIEKNASNNPRYSIKINEELINYLSRSGFKLEDILPEGLVLNLSHRRGQLSGGYTHEFIEELHPSFIPVLEKAAKVVGLSVVGFDCIIPDPKSDQANQKWGIIECNTLPFIDMHYYALEGKPRNIAGMIWDLWGV
jgi:cyanophycin synthetase